MSARRPDYRVFVIEEEGFSEVGKAWLNSTGTITVTINPYVALPARAKLKLSLMLLDYKPKSAEVEAETPAES